MKKLMIGIVGALAMVASAEVTSGIVGYTTRPIENFKFVGPAFTKCATVNGDFQLRDLATNCAMTEEDAGSGWVELGDSVVILDSNGSYVRKLVFLPQYLADYADAEQGWYDSDAANDFDFSDKWDDKVEWQPGEAFQVSADAGAAIIINPAQ